MNQRLPGPHERGTKVGLMTASGMLGVASVGTLMAATPLSVITACAFLGAAGVMVAAASEVGRPEGKSRMRLERRERITIQTRNQTEVIEMEVVMETEVTIERPR